MHPLAQLLVEIKKPFYEGLTVNSIGHVSFPLSIHADDPSATVISENDSFRRSPSGEESENTPHRPTPLPPIPLPVTTTEPFSLPLRPLPTQPPKLPPKPPGISSQNYVTLRRILQEIQSNPASIPNQRYHIEPVSPKSPESKPKFATVGRSRSLRLSAPMDHLDQHISPFY